MRITARFARFGQKNLSALILPLILPFLLMPLSNELSVRLLREEGYVYLIYLPLAMYIGMLLVFDWLALPGIFLALCLYYFPRYNSLQAVVIISATLLAVSLGWKGYKAHAGKRWRANHGGLSLMQVRLLWLVFLNCVIFILIMQLVVWSGVISSEGTVFPTGLFTLNTLLNFQSLFLSCVTMIQIYYYGIRCIRKPRFARVAWNRMKKQCATGVNGYELMVWSVLLITLLTVLVVFDKDKENLLTSDYGMPLLLPLMLWSAMRFGHLFTSFSWAVLLILLYQLRDRFLSPGIEPHHLAVMSANLLVFSLTILMMAAISTRQRRTLMKAKMASLSDPVFHLPNLRALSADLSEMPLTILCFLSIPDLDRLSRIYGLRLRIQYKRSLALHLIPDFQPGEKVYQLPGFDLAIRLDYVGHQARIENMAARLKDYHLHWEGLPLSPDIGLSYCSVRHPVTHLYELLGEMSVMADQSLRTGRVINSHQNNSLPLQRRMAEKVVMLEEVRATLREQGYPLWVQRVKGIRGDDYYEIQPEIHDSTGEPLLEERLEELGLTWEVDRWVIEQTLAFFHQHLPDSRFALMLFNTTFCRPKLAEEIAQYLDLYELEPWQLIVQVPDSPLISHSNWGSRSIMLLLQLGCQVMVTNFGCEFAGYARLGKLEGDMLKINRRFVDNMLDSSLDYQIIVAICALARSKRMRVVACGVDSAEIEEGLRVAGVEYLQGELSGTAQPLDNLIQAGPEIPGQPEPVTLS